MTEEEQFDHWLESLDEEQLAKIEERAKQLRPAVRNLLEKELPRHQAINEKAPSDGVVVQKEADRFGRLNRGTRDKEVRANWHISAVIEQYENLLEDSGLVAANRFLLQNQESLPELGLTDADLVALVEVDRNMLPALLAKDPAVQALVRRGKASPVLLEKLQMHQSAISAEEEAGIILRNTECETGLEPTLTQRRPRDINDQDKVFDVEFKEPDRIALDEGEKGKPIGRDKEDIWLRLLERNENEDDPGK